MDGHERSARVVGEPEELVGRRHIGRERLLDDQRARRPRARLGRSSAWESSGVQTWTTSTSCAARRGLEVDVGSPDAESARADASSRSTTATTVPSERPAAGCVPAAPSSPRADDRGAHALPARALRCSPRGDSTSASRPDPQGLRAGDQALWDIDEHVAAAPAGREALPQPSPSHSQRRRWARTMPPGDGASG